MNASPSIRPRAFTLVEILVVIAIIGILRYASDTPETAPLRDADIGNTRIMRDVNSCCVSRFGSPHTGGLQMAMCDGSIQDVSYSIDLAVYRFLGTRDDGYADQSF